MLADAIEHAADRSGGAIDSGSATMATVNPAMASARSWGQP